MKLLYQVHIFVELFGGRFLLRKGIKDDSKWCAAAFGDVKGVESYEKAAIRALQDDLGLEALHGDLDKIAAISPGVSDKHITLFTYLMDQKREELKLDTKKVGEVVASDLADVIADVEGHKDDYAPVFIETFNIFLALAKNTGEYDKWTLY